MKRRHIESFGFHFVSIPFWKYRHDLPDSEKIQIIRNCIVKKEKDSLVNREVEK